MYEKYQDYHDPMCQPMSSMRSMPRPDSRGYSEMSEMVSPCTKRRSASSASSASSANSYQKEPSIKVMDSGRIEAELIMESPRIMRRKRSGDETISSTKTSSGGMEAKLIMEHHVRPVDAEELRKSLISNTIKLQNRVL